MNLMGLGGHVHKRASASPRGPRTAPRSSRTSTGLIRRSPPSSPPHVLAPGDWIDFECLHDNGVTRPVHHDATGDPATLVFGTSAEDEMCILTGQYYDD